ncbi:hypothetical protein AVEN_101000-1 [Araneus ventricosus]|uniref:Uncharacterized protein n=1 Tax=Araneus ventricosus TaxID=182803 RepID=A0A4Y2VSE4_ARAVE|nr:hypothetical protein AVEN_101000-1 [Araneus ventricosus]
MQKPFASTSPNSKGPGSVDDNQVGNVGPRQTAVTSENGAKVSGIVQQNPRNTVRRIASEAGLKRSNTQKILKQPTDVSIQNPKSSDHTYKSCATKADAELCRRLFQLKIILCLSLTRSEFQEEWLEEPRTISHYGCLQGLMHVLDGAIDQRVVVNGPDATNLEIFLQATICLAQYSRNRLKRHKTQNKKPTNFAKLDASRLSKFEPDR